MSPYALPVDNLVIAQGTTFARAYPVSGPVMAGATVKAQIRDTANSALLQELTIILIPDGTDPNAGVVTVSVAPATSNAWTWTEGVWDALLTAADGSVSRISGGRVFVSQAVTRT